ncbi:MAG: group 1 truncated hemoglobin [Blastocatellia bacterium]
MKRNYCLSLSLVFAVLITCVGLARTASAQSDSLYKRLGGYDALAAVTDDFITRLATDKMLGRFFVGASDNSKMRIRQLVLDQLCAATGGPCVYIGRDMKTAHKGLGITEEDWNTAVKHLVATLTKFKVPEKEQKEVAGALTTLKGDIVEKP